QCAIGGNLPVEETYETELLRKFVWPRDTAPSISEHRALGRQRRSARRDVLVAAHAGGRSYRCLVTKLHGLSAGGRDGTLHDAARAAEQIRSYRAGRSSARREHGEVP